MRLIPPVTLRLQASAAALSLLAAWGIETAHAGTTTVTTCGQTVSGKGVFTADLDCTGFVGDALTLTAGASLDFAGFTLTGGTEDAIGCEGKCTIYSSAALKGVIRDAGGTGISSEVIVGLSHQVKVKVRDMQITGNGSHGIGAGLCCPPDRAIVLDSEITGNGGVGVWAITKASVRRSVVSSNGSGISSGIVAVTESESDNNATHGIRSGLFGFRARDTRANGNGSFGFSSAGVTGSIRFRNCEAVGNTTDGVFFERIANVRVQVSGGTFSNNGRDGIHFDDGQFITNIGARISKATLSGNTANGFFVGPDEPLTSLRVRTITADGNGEAGITGAFLDKGLDVRGSTLSGNGTYGLRNLAPTGSPSGPCPVAVSSSTVSGNGIDADCGSVISCADVAACEFPDLASNVVCDTSYDTTSGFPGTTWGVCTAD